MDASPFVTPMAIALGMFGANYLEKRGISPLVVTKAIGWCVVVGGGLLALNAALAAPDEKLGFLALGFVVALVGLSSFS
jgi:hypothetical protein